MQKTLAIIGASYIQLPLVLKAKELGVQTICFAWEEGAVCKDVSDEFYPISIIEKEQILEVCRKEGIDGITTIATDVAVPTISYVAKQLGLIGNSVDCVCKSTNKFAMRVALKNGGVNCPAFSLIHDIEETKKALESIGLPVIVKPCDRSGSMGDTKVEQMEQLADAVEFAAGASFSKAAVLEQFVDIAQEVSVEGISWKGEHHALAVTDKVTTGTPHYAGLGQASAVAITEGYY